MRSPILAAPLSKVRRARRERGKQETGKVGQLQTVAREEETQTRTFRARGGKGGGNAIELTSRLPCYASLYLQLK